MLFGRGRSRRCGALRFGSSATAEVDDRGELAVVTAVRGERLGIEVQEVAVERELGVGRLADRFGRRRDVRRRGWSRRGRLPVDATSRARPGC
jgi:hypothetical protein